MTGYHVQTSECKAPVAKRFFLSLGRVFPEWKVYSEFINEHLNRALDLDAKLSSHPIEVDCPDANQINQVRLASDISCFA